MARCNQEHCNNPSNCYYCYNYFDPDKCKEKYQSFLDGNFDNSFFVWQLINLEEWHSVFQDADPVSDRHYLNNAINSY